MDNELKVKHSHIFMRHFRNIAGSPDGAIAHDGDCGLYNAYLGVCTCGLHHALIIIPNDAEKIYPKYWEEQQGKSKVEMILMEEDHLGLWVGCNTCDATGGTGMIECEKCKGKGVIPFKMPDLPTEEEVEERMNMIKEMFEKKDKENTNGKD